MFSKNALIKARFVQTNPLLVHNLKFKKHSCFNLFSFSDNKRLCVAIYTLNPKHKKRKRTTTTINE
jgi:hypothetical protein